MIDFDDIKKYLPQYLSSNEVESLFSELSQFPSNIDKRIYTKKLKNDEFIYQGDGLNNLLFVNLPEDTEAKPNMGMILSNTCDIDSQNKRLFGSRMAYTPIFNLQKYKNFLIERFVNTSIKSLKSIDSHIEDIKRQYISQVFYLPKGDCLENESIIFLDRINNLPSNYFKNDEITENRMFSLSDYGFYLFLFKLSIHFTRVKESVHRG